MSDGDVLLSDRGFVMEDVKRFWVRGGLKRDDRSQRYDCVFVRGVKGLPSKFVLSFSIARPSDGSWVEKPKSLRFDSYGDAYTFFNQVLRGLVRLGVDQKVILRENYGFHVDGFRRRFESVVREELRLRGGL